MSDVEIFYEYAKGVTESVGKAWIPKTVGLIDNVLSLVLYKIISIGKLSNKEKGFLLNAVKDLDEQLSESSAEMLQPIIEDIGIPIINRLAYISCPEVRSLYINMLAIAADKNKSQFFHPRHLEIVPSLSGEELKLLKDFFVSPNKCIMLYEHLVKMPERDEATYIGVNEIYPKCFENVHNILLMLENIFSLGILKQEDKIHFKLNDDHMNYIKDNFIVLESKFDLTQKYKYRTDSKEFASLSRDIVERAEYVEFLPTLYNITPLGTHLSKFF